MLVNGKPGNLISIRDRGLLYGDGVFRTLRVFGGQALHWPLHYQKLQHDCTCLGIACPDLTLLSAELNDLVKLHSDGVFKVIVTRGEGKRGYTPVQQADSNHVWDVLPCPDYPDHWPVTGIKARLCQLRLGFQPRLAGIKHLNRLENVLAAGEWSDADIAEGLLMDGAGNIIEGTRSNLFLVKQGKLITPELARCGVAGVQRDRVMDWAMRNNIPLQVRDISLEEVLQADELFLVNSIMLLWPLRELEMNRWTSFPMATEIRRSLEGAAG
jgi:4-amino-4-deoxychorismate lyase